MRQPTDHPWRTLSVLCLVVLLVVVDNTVVNVALPTLARDLHASNSSLQWMVDGYSLPFAALMLAGGGLADRWGRRRVMSLALLAFNAFSLLASDAHGVASLLTARALMGAAAAFIFPATLSILTVAFRDAKQRATAFGVWGATAGAAIALGPIVGGELIDHFWFGSIFLINVPIGVLAWSAVVTLVPESRSPLRRRMDLVGLTLGTTGVGTLTLAIIEGPSWGWRSPRILGLFALCAVLLGAFIAYERRRAAPLLNVHIFRSRPFSAGAIAIATNFFLLFGFVFLVTQYFQVVRGYSALDSGVRTLPFALVVMVTTPLAAFVAARVGARYVIPTGLLIMSGSLWWIGRLAANAPYVGALLAAMIGLGMGFSLVSTPATGVTMNSLTPDQVGAGASVNETNRELGGTLGVAVIGSVFSSLFGPAVHRALQPLLGTFLTPSQIARAQGSMPGAVMALRHVPPRLRAGVEGEIVHAFMEGFHRSCFVAAFVGVVVALGIATFLPRGPLSSATHHVPNSPVPVDGASTATISGINRTQTS